VAPICLNCEMPETDESYGRSNGKAHKANRLGSSISHNPGLFGRMMKTRTAKFQIGQVVKHRIYPFRGVIFDIDPEFNNTEEWWLSIPEEVRPRKDQPFYHLLAENSDSEYIAYVSEQNLLPDTSGEPVRHSQVAEIFVKDRTGGYRPRNSTLN
jgi:heat shock protein HspQ